MKRTLLFLSLIVTTFSMNAMQEGHNACSLPDNTITLYYDVPSTEASSTARIFHVAPELTIREVRKSVAPQIGISSEELQVMGVNYNGGVQKKVLDNYKQAGKYDALWSSHQSKDIDIIVPVEPTPPAKASAQILHIPRNKTVYDVKKLVNERLNIPVGVQSVQSFIALGCRKKLLKDYQQLYPYDTLNILYPNMPVDNIAAALAAVSLAQANNEESTEELTEEQDKRELFMSGYYNNNDSDNEADDK